MIVKMKKHTLLCMAILVLIPLMMLSCKKEPGPGGKSTIYGKVLVKDYNSTFTVLEETYYAPQQWVYLVYGDDRDYGDRVQTGIDGSWEFKYMRPGTYKVYALSKDSTLQTMALLPVVQEVTVPSKKTEIEVPDIVIFN